MHTGAAPRGRGGVECEERGLLPTWPVLVRDPPPAFLPQGWGPFPGLTQLHTPPLDFSGNPALSSPSLTTFPTDRSPEVPPPCRQAGRAVTDAEPTLCVLEETPVSRRRP